MATNFLPFVTSTSSEKAILNAILKRTKGSSYNAIADLFAILMHLGIDQARQKIDNYPANLTTSAKLQEFTSDHREFHTSKSAFSYWSYVLNMGDVKTPEDTGFSKAEFEVYFCTLASKFPSKLESAGIVIDIEKYKKFEQKDFDMSSAAIKSVVFTNSGKRIGFTSWNEFKAYIASRQNDDAEVLEVMPVHVKKDISEVTPADYENLHCVSPY